MNGRAWKSFAVVGLLGLLAAPALGQPGMGPGWWSGPEGGTGRPLSMSQAEVIARQTIAQSGFQGLAPMHIMEFNNNFYVAVKDKATGEGAFELLIDRYTGFVRPEPQSMMWNTKYGHMAWWGGPGYGMMGPGSGSGRMGGGMMGGGHGGPGGMMGGYGYAAPGTVPPPGAPLPLAQAKTTAQRFLSTHLVGANTDEAIIFPGYYTIDVARNGRPIGMLSVNMSTGAVWYHAWHGTFIREKDLM
jgi:hypothetical protein